MTCVAKTKFKLKKMLEINSVRPYQFREQEKASDSVPNDSRD